jgi:hypothetical protein
MMRHSPDDKPLWSGCGDNRGVEQCSGFDRVLLGEICANQSTPFSGKQTSAIEVLADHVVVGLECTHDIAVAPREILRSTSESRRLTSHSERPSNAIQHRLEVLSHSWERMGRVITRRLSARNRTVD